MRVKIRSVFRVFAWIIGAFLALWLLVWGYVILNKKSLIKQVNMELNSRVKGDIKIGDLEPSLLSTFPSVSIRLSNVVVRDSLWKQHHSDLLKADDIFIRLKFFSLFSGTPEISKVIIRNGAIHVFSDSTGYSNEYMFKAQKDTAKDGNSVSRATLPDIELNKVRVIMALADRDKKYDFDINRLNCNIKTRENSLQIDVKMDMFVHSLAFNTDRGSFAKEKPLEGNVRLQFDRVKRRLKFDNAKLQIDDHPFTFSGMFDFLGVPPLYYLSIKTEKLNYRKASKLLSDNITSRLDSFNIEKPITVSVIIDGTIVPNRIPVISLEVNVKNNNISLPIGEFTESSFTGYFKNRLISSERPVDKNSGFYFTGFTGKWEGIQIKSDTVSITNLEHPVLSCDLHSSFKLEMLNELLGANSILFTNGRCEADVRYKGLIIEGDTAGASINGSLRLRDAGINYTPRNLLLTNCSGNIVFDEKDVYVRQMKAQVASTQLTMNGGMKNLTSLIDKSPEKLVLDWNIASPKLNLNDFLSFLNKRSASANPNASKRRFLKLANQIDRLLQDCNVELQLNADRLTYKKFDASKVAANLQLTDRNVTLKNMSVEHAGGSLTLNGSMQEGATQNSIVVNSAMENVDISKIFTAFNNFGQDGIVDKNLKGRLSANINITGAITGKAEMVENSLKGMIDLRVKNGELINFEPIQKISQTAFKNRDFTDIKFAELKEKLEVNGSQIKVNRMEIQSTVMTMFVEGVYDIKKGTDLSIQIPLNNLAKRGDEFVLKNKGINSKTGVSVRLRAKTGEDGKAKITWDPFKLALKKGSSGAPDSSRLPVADSSQGKSRRNKRQSN
ncbi:MAG: AsmA-like C-terminal region-containing protein [Chitinophagaceae bacterium]